MNDKVNRAFNGVLYSLVGHLHNYITNNGMTGVLDAYIENVNDTYGAVKLHLQNRNGVNGALYEQLGSVDLIDFVFKTLTQQSNIRFECRSGNLINALNTTGEWQIGPPGTPWLVLGSTGAQLTGSVNAKGADKQVQFNDSGVVAGDANFTWDKTTRQLELGAAVAPGALGLFGDTTTEPVSEPTKVLIYSKNVAGRYIPKWIGPANLDQVVQPSLGFTNTRLVGPASGTTATTCMSATSTAFTNVASTITQPVIANTSVKTKIRSVTLATSTTVGNIASHRSTVQEALGATGYFFTTRFYLNTINTNNRGFFGLWGNAVVATNVNPTTDITVAKVGLCFATNTGNWQIVSSTTAAVTNTDLGATMPINTTDVMELVLFCAPGGTTIGYRVTNITTGATVSGTLSTNVPAVTVAMAVNMWHTNNTAGVAVGFGLNKWYLETDY